MGRQMSGTRLLIQTQKVKNTISMDLCLHGVSYDVSTIPEFSEYFEYLFQSHSTKDKSVRLNQQKDDDVLFSEMVYD